MERRNKAIVTALIIFGVVSLTRTVFLLWNGELQDLAIIYSSVHLLLSGINPYSSSVLPIQVNYPPQLLIILSPLTLLSLSVVGKLWIIGSVLALLISFYLLYKVKPVPKMLCIGMATASVLSFPFKYTLGMGQVNIFVLMCIAGMIYAGYGKKRGYELFYTAGLFLKIFPSLLILIPLVRKKYKQVILSIAVVTVISVLSIIIASWETHSYYLSHVLFPLVFSHGTGDYYYNQSLLSFFMRADIPLNLYFLLRFIALGGVAYLLIIKKSSVFADASLLITTILLFSGLTWQHYLILLVIPLYYVISAIRSKRAYVFVLCAYLLVSFNIHDPSLFNSTAFSTIILSHGTIGIGIVWFMLLFYRNPSDHVKIQ